MKTILFATGNEAFENAVMNQLKNMTSEEYKNVGYVLHKETIIARCNELKPDILVLNDDLDGGTPTLDVIREFKENLSESRLIFITKPRQIGDAVMASVVAYGYYDIITDNPVSVRKVAELIVNPNNYQAVSRYMPNMMASKDGNELLFDTKIVERGYTAGKDLDDIDDSTPDLSKNITPLERLDVAKEIDDENIGDIEIDQNETRIEEQEELDSLEPEKTKFSKGQSLQRLTILSPMGLNFGSSKPKHSSPEDKLKTLVQEIEENKEEVKKELPRLNLLSDSKIQNPVLQKGSNFEVQPKAEVEYAEQVLDEEENVGSIMDAINESRSAMKEVLDSREDISAKIMNETVVEEPEEEVVEPSVEYSEYLKAVEEDQHETEQAVNGNELLEEIDKLAPLDVEEEPEDVVIEKIFEIKDFEWNIPGKIFGFIRTNYSSSFTSVNLAYLLAKQGKRVVIVETSNESPIDRFFENGRINSMVEGDVSKKISYLKTKCVDVEEFIREKQLREKYDFIFIESVVGHAIGRVLPLLDYKMIQGTEDKFVVGIIKKRYPEIFRDYMLILDPFNNEENSFYSVSKAYPGKHITSAVLGAVRLTNKAYANKVPVFVEDEDSAENAYAFLMKNITTFNQKGGK